MKCPFCAEEIADEARICKWCRSDLSAVQNAVLGRTSGKATASLILGIFFFLFPAGGA